MRPDATSRRARPAVVDAPADELRPARRCRFAAGRRNAGADRQHAGISAQDERLFNLSNDEVPPGFSRFASLIEIVGQGEEERADGRQRARFYKDRGYAVRYVDLLRKN
jgi:hypothetical protein